MTTLLKSAATPVWAVLMITTITSYLLGEDHAFGVSTQTASVLILTLAVVKVMFVTEFFMEMRYAPLPLRLAFIGWGLVVALSTVGIYLLG
ncbi:MAG TPA: cytochrome C oxidase subunit IV family protein [Nocardioidaceae bacterium]|nr:cytochrome C oxidase subunit IV family protein [Nocardioidaceae bacterium]